MEAICSSETSIATQQTTRRHIPEDDTLYNYHYSNIVYTLIILLSYFNNEFYYANLLQYGI
jgi:hypothetical protein